MNNAAKLRIGKIPYANLFPIFYMLEREFDCSAYEFIEGVPSRLNWMLRSGAVDLSPSSSVEYLRHPSLYTYIANHSVSSRGAVGSIFLFSERPLEELDGCAIQVTAQSETSVALLDIILNKFYGKHPVLLPSDNPGGAAFLLIGDDALKGGGPAGRRKKTAPPFQYDLGELWYRHTGLPFVFALWIVRKECSEKRDLLDGFIRDLDKAKEMALKNLPEIAMHAPMRSFMSTGDLLAYWSKLDYELDEEHKKGLDLFDRYLKELA